MTGIERAPDIQFGRPQVPVQMAVECPMLGRLDSTPSRFRTTHWTCLCADIRGSSIRWIWPPV